MNRRKFIQLAGAVLAVAVLPPLVGGKPANDDFVELDEVIFLDMADDLGIVNEMPWSDDGAIWYIGAISQGDFQIATGDGSPVQIVSVADTSGFQVGDQITIG